MGGSSNCCSDNAPWSNGISLNCCNDNTIWSNGDSSKYFDNDLPINLNYTNEYMPCNGDDISKLAQWAKL